MKHKPAQTSLTTSKPAVSDDALYQAIAEHLRTYGMTNINNLRSTLLSNPPTSVEIEQLDRVLRTKGFSSELLQQGNRPHYVQTWYITPPRRSPNSWSRW